MAKPVSSALTPTGNKPESDATPLPEVRKRHIVRWYVMVYPTSNRTMTEELDRELARRQRDNESLFEYFAPVLVEARKINGRLVTTRRSLLYNYLFVHASECEIYRIKQRLPQYNKALYEQVKVILDTNKAQRHIRGGLATRKKYKGE